MKLAEYRDKEKRHMQIVDFHVHPFLSPAENTCFYQEGFSLTPDQAISDLKHEGITEICGSVIRMNGYSKKNGFAQIADLNRLALQIAKKQSLFYTPGFHVHPAFVHQSLETIEFMNKNGYRLIGEIVPNIHRWNEYGLDYGSKELYEILELADDYRMIVSFHTMPDQQKQMEKMIADHPNISFVAAHPGEAESYQYHLNRMKKYNNAYLDLSGTGLLRYGMLRYGIQKVGAEKFIFGTDYPIVNPGMYVQAVFSEKISQKDRDLILARNALRLLNQ